MSLKEYTSKRYFQQLTILHLGMMSGMIMLLAVMLFVLNPESTGDSPTFWLYIIGGIVLFDLLIFTKLIPNRIEKIKQKGDLKTKMGDYYTIFVMKLALIEGPAIVSIIAYFLNGDKIFLMIGTMLIAFFALNRPTKDKIIQLLDLNREESQAVNNPDAIIALIRRK